jgi:hypothetical protein
MSPGDSLAYLSNLFYYGEDDAIATAAKVDKGTSGKAKKAKEERNRGVTISFNYTVTEMTRKVLTISIALWYVVWSIVPFLPEVSVYLFICILRRDTKQTNNVVHETKHQCFRSC